MPYAHRPKGSWACGCDAGACADCDEEIAANRAGMEICDDCEQRVKRAEAAPFTPMGKPVAWYTTRYRCPGCAAHREEQRRYYSY